MNAVTGRHKTLLETSREETMVKKKKTSSSHSEDNASSLRAVIGKVRRTKRQSDGYT